jgi:hypothetical protein
MNYGFPYCMTEYNLQGISSAAKGLGAQWGHPSFMNDSLSLDEYCQNEENNRKPAFNIAANSIASSVAFYMGTFCSVGTLTTGGTSVGLPCNWTDTPIVANHGLSGQAQGHSVVRLPFDDLGHKPRWDKEPEVLLAEAQPCAGPGCLSPSGLTFDTFGRLYVSSDETNEIYIVSRIYNQEASVKLTQLVEAGEEKRDSPNSDEMENFYAKIGDEEARAKHKGKKKKDEDE